MTIIQIIRYWAKGIRLYIALTSVLITFVVVWWADTAYGGTTLFPTRVEETFAWLAVGLLGLALSIGPFLKLFPGAPGRGLLFDARRLIGVSAAWFTTLHAGIAYFGQFGGANPFSLPDNYQRAFLFGAIAAIVLLAMAFTSFDAAFKRMGIWWFRLHRLVYITVVAALLHAFMIGVHATHVLPLILIGGISLVLIAAYVTLMVRQTKQVSIWQIATTSGMALFILAVLGYGLAQHLGHAVLGSIGGR